MNHMVCLKGRQYELHGWERGLKYRTKTESTASPGGDVVPSSGFSRVVRSAADEILRSAQDDNPGGTGFTLKHQSLSLITKSLFATRYSPLAQ
jgi:hypothetical protein